MRVCDLVIEGSVMLENPVSILSADVTGCEWLDSACIRFNKWLWRMTLTTLSTRLQCISFCILMGYKCVACIHLNYGNELNHINY